MIFVSSSLSSMLCKWIILSLLAKIQITFEQRLPQHSRQVFPACFLNTHRKGKQTEQKEREKKKEKKLFTKRKLGSSAKKDEIIFTYGCVAKIRDCVVELYVSSIAKLVLNRQRKRDNPDKSAVWKEQKKKKTVEYASKEESFSYCVWPAFVQFFFAGK